MYKFLLIIGVAFTTPIISYSKADTIVINNTYYISGGNVNVNNYNNNYYYHFNNTKTKEECINMSKHLQLYRNKDLKIEGCVDWSFITIVLCSLLIFFTFLISQIPNDLL